MHAVGQRVLSEQAAWLFRLRGIHEFLGQEEIDD